MLGNIKEEQGTIDAPIGRHKTQRKKMAVVDGGREARTHFRVIYRFGNATLVSCRLETGRTHQIRVHMAYIGHPVLNDPVYGPKSTKHEKGQLLHAARIALCIQEQQSAYVFMRLWMNIFQNNSKVGKLTQKHYTKLFGHDIVIPPEEIISFEKRKVSVDGKSGKDHGCCTGRPCLGTHGP